MDISSIQFAVMNINELKLCHVALLNILLQNENNERIVFLSLLIFGSTAHYNTVTVFILFVCLFME